MTIKIIKFSKIDLTQEADIDLDFEVSNGMTISHYADSVKASSATIPFTIEGVDKHVPQFGDEKWQVVVREKIDLTATGPDEGVKKEVGKDVGKYEYKDSVPAKPLGLPPGFQELYRKK